MSVLGRVVGHLLYPVVRLLHRGHGEEVRGLGGVQAAVQQERDAADAEEEARTAGNAGEARL